MQSIPAAAIETSTGRFVDVSNPDPDTIVLTDIAYALSRIPRFSGHALGENVYSVAQHSLNTADLVRQLFALTKVSYSEAFERLNMFLGSEDTEKCLRKINSAHVDSSMGQFDLGMIEYHALMHDATEAYLVDIPSPIKQHTSIKEAYRPIEKNLEKIIFEKFFVWRTEVSDLLVTWADLEMLRVEAWHYMPSRGLNWGINKNLQTMLTPLYISDLPPIMPWKEASVQFFQHATALAHELKLFSPPHSA